MLNRRFLLEGAALVVLAAACAFTANLFAGKERRLSLVQDYPGALEVPSHQALPAPAPVPSPAAPPPAPVEPAVAAGAAPAPAGSPGEASPAGRAIPPPSPAGKPAPAAPAAPREGAARLSEAELLARYPPHHQPYREVTGDDVAVLHQAGALVLDARRTQVFAEGHIAGARPFSIWESDVKEKIEALVGEGRSGDAPVVIYCSGGECEDSHMLAQQLFGAGFNNLLVYRDGWPDWVKRAGPRASGGRP